MQSDSEIEGVFLEQTSTGLHRKCSAGVGERIHNSHIQMKIMKLEKVIFVSAPCGYKCVGLGYKCVGLRKRYCTTTR